LFAVASSGVQVTSLRNVGAAAATTGATTTTLQHCRRHWTELQHYTLTLYGDCTGPA